MYPTRNRLLTILGVCVVAAACDGRSSSPTAPSTSAQTGGASSSLSASSRRSGELHLTKDCTDTYNGQAGDFCTITESTLSELQLGSRVVYQQAADFPSLSSDVILYPPRSGNSIAFGHCELAFETGLGRCNFSGGTGKFKGFQASVDVTCVGLICTLDGDYSFSRRD